jgi:hypothetical protein
MIRALAVKGPAVSAGAATWALPSVWAAMAGFGIGRLPADWPVVALTFDDPVGL